MAGLKGKDLKDAWANFTSSGNEPAFYIIYSHYHHYLNIIGNKRNFSKDKISDSISDLFLYMWENHANLQSIDNHHNYIITAFLRKLYRKNSFIMEDIEFADTLTSPSVEHLFIQQHIDDTISELIQEKINQLADKQRHMIYQKFYLGLSYQEIANGNQVSVNTVYNTIYKATSKLKSMISKEEEAYLSLAVMSILFFLFFFQIQ